MRPVKEILRDYENLLIEIMGARKASIGSLHNYFDLHIEVAQTEKRYSELQEYFASEVGVQPEIKQLLAGLVGLEKETTRGEWILRNIKDEDDPFIERPRIKGEAYGREIMSDEKYSTKKADAEFIIGAKRIAQELSKLSV